MPAPAADAPTDRPYNYMQVYDIVELGAFNCLQNIKRITEQNASIYFRDSQNALQGEPVKIPG